VSPKNALPLSLVLALALPLALALGLGAGCSAFQTNLQDTNVSYQDTARQNYEEGDKAFENERWEESIKFFEHVKNKYPYSKYAVLADLRIADAHFEREKWLEAADAYRMFVRFHPRHEKVGYATYRIAKAYGNGMAGGGFLSFLFPSSQEMDQTSTRDAIRAADDYLSRFPDGEHVQEVSELRTTARTRLAENDRYAAEFYEKRNKWQGAAWRWQHIADEFGDTPLAPEALLKCADLHAERLDKREEAKALYERLVTRYPESAEASRAKERLEKL
jgi:outer membrane protein assembly factor BamD